MKQITRLLVAALVAAAIATIVVQRDRLRQIDRAEMVASIRNAIESRLPGRGESLDATLAEGTDTPVDEVVEVAEERAEAAADEAVADGQ